MQIKPMLAKKYEGVLPKEYVLQPKLNGHRAIWDGKKLWSRQGNEINSVPHIIKELEKYDFYLDGELYSDKIIDFENLTGVIRRTVKFIDSTQIYFCIYDLPDTNGKPYKERREFLESIKFKYPLVLIEEKMDKDLNCYGKKYEGTMIRDLNSPYKPGKRSSGLLKVKKFHDDEAEIIGVTQLFNYEKVIVEKKIPGAKQYADGTWYKNGDKTPTNKIGALVCKYKNIEFEIGSGLSDELREKFWKNPPIGKQVTFSYQVLSKNKVPIFPTFVRIREDI